MSIAPNIATSTRPAPTCPVPTLDTPMLLAELADLVEQYSLATARGHDLVHHLPLDTPPAWWPADLFGPWRRTRFRARLSGRSGRRRRRSPVP